MSGAEPWIGSYRPWRPCGVSRVAERRRRQHPQRARDHRRLVRQDVAEQVLGHEDVEARRPARERHRRRVDEAVLQLDVGEVRVDLVGRPCATAGSSRGRWPCRPGSPSGGGSRASSNARVTIRRISASVYHSVSIAARPSSVSARLAGLAEVQPGGELADDQAVDALEQLGLERRRVDQLAVDGDRAQVREQAEAAAEREQRLLRADGGVGVVPLRPADRAEQDRVGVAARLHVLGPARRCRTRRSPAPPTTSSVQSKPNPNRRPGRLEDRDGPGHDLGPDPVARDERDAVRSRGRVPSPASRAPSERRPRSREVLGVRRRRTRPRCR